MHIFRRLFLVLITPLFTLLLFLTALDWGTVSVVGHPDNVKRIVADSGTYSSIIPSLISQNKQISSAIGTIPLTDPAIASAANQAIPPSFIKQQTNNAIDAIYGWLNGKTAQPSFNIDLSGAKNNFAEDVSAQARQRVSTLPTCTNLYTASSFDVYNATCLPPGVTPTAVASTVKQAVLNGDGFVNSSINAQSLKSGNSNQSIFNDQLKSLPGWYQWFKKSPLILIGLAVIVAALIFILSPNRARGLRRVGWALLSVGLIMLIFSWGFTHIVNKNILPHFSVGGGQVQDKVRAVLSDLAREIDKNYLTFGIVYLVLGVLALLLPTAFNRRRQSEAVTEVLAQPATPQEPGPPTPKRRPPQKVQ